MTYDEIVKALECCCGKCEDDCKNCPIEGVRWKIDVYKDALDLIKRQKIEIDILIRKKETLRDEIAEQQAEIERLREIEYMYNDLCR